ncbi:MAG: prepilin-type N-terminal cleavage/methylation domain-containing protein [Planctomycetota bacterium]
MRTLLHPPTRRPHPAGFTLAEVLLASAILAFSAAALSQAVLSGQAHTYHALHEAKAISLLQSTMEQVLALPYEDPDGDTTPGPDPGEIGPSFFDAMDDYEGWISDAGTLTDANWRPLPQAYQRFSIAVGVAATNTGVIGVLGTDSDGVEVKVGVTDDQGQTWTAVRFVPETSLVAGSAPRASAAPSNSPL